MAFGNLKSSQISINSQVDFVLTAISAPPPPPRLLLSYLFSLYCTILSVYQKRRRRRTQEMKKRKRKRGKENIGSSGNTSTLQLSESTVIFPEGSQSQEGGTRWPSEFRPLPLWFLPGPLLSVLSHSDGGISPLTWQLHIATLIGTFQVAEPHTL